MGETVYSDDLTIDCTWWNATEKGKKPHEILVGLMETMKSRQSTLHDNTQKCIAIFQWGGDARKTGEQDDPPLEETCLAFNAAQNLVETIHSKVCKNRIIPMALTSGGGPRGAYLARHRAKQLSRALEGELDENNADEIVEDVVMDALVSSHGAGCAKVFERCGRVKIEHVPIEDIRFDDAEIRYRRPRSAYHVQQLDKFVLLAEYGIDKDDLYGEVEERRNAILKAGVHQSQVDRATRGKATDSSQVEVYEAWHLPSASPEDDDDDSAPESGDDYETTTGTDTDGRHVIAIDGCTLVDEPWEHDFFPLVFYVPRKRRRSIWGLSLMFDLVAPQREYEKLTQKVQIAHQKMGLTGLVAPRTANVNGRDFTAGNAGPGFLAEYDGQIPPTQMVVDPVPPGTYAYKDSIPRDMSQSKGVSQLSAQSQLPAGLQQASGKALQVFEDFESERLLPYHRELERFIVGLSWLIVHTARDIVERKSEYKVKYRGKRALEELDWGAILNDAKDFILKVFPIGQLSRQPSARFAQLNEMLNSGAITIEQWKRLYGLPDLEAESEIDTADTDIIDRNLDIIVTTGRYLSPEPFDNLQLIVERAGKFYNLCRQYEVPDSRLKLVADVIDDAKGLIKQAKEKAAQEAAAAGPPPGAGPPGMPPGAAPPPMPGPGMPPPGAPPMPAAA